ncbi:IPT/TIG domain-containing protein [Gynurincola endophyticus]|uniref:IPT/TIG domain-containing protein n=1 Tax=Gynurincola endophyticus TaxID=2479004 RepID=UPI001315A7AD|nr:IPT/TIG domain-containing protein [Gynurincola endophyticus]
MKKIFQPNILLAFLLLSTGWMACKQDSDGPLTINTVTPTEGPGGEVIALTGDGLKDIASVHFDNQDVPAFVNPAFVTNNTVLLRVPDTAFGGLQKIVFTGKDGKTSSIPFSVIALPNIASADKYDFEEGTVINFTGNNFDDVHSVKLLASNQEATILSQTRKNISIQMPAASVDYTKLSFTNSSGTREPDITFTNFPNHYIIWDEAMDNSKIYDWGWGGTYTTSTERVLIGDYSYKCDMRNNDWGAIQLVTDNNPAINISGYSFLSFYVYGGTKDINFDVKLNWFDIQTITVVANRWNYYKIPLQAAKNAGNSSVNSIVMQVRGTGELVYMDNLLFIK